MTPSMNIISRRRFLQLAAGGAVMLGMPGGGLCAEDVPVREVRIVSTHHHDPEAFTQGLLLADGILYESTGLYGKSDVRKVDPKTGRVLLKKELPNELFGEGLTMVGDKLYQLTWKQGVVIVYDAITLQPTAWHSYTGEGWGLVWDGKRFLMTDGSAQVTARNLAFEKQSSTTVTSDKGPVKELNELELIPGALLANVWKTWRVAYIDVQSGRVLAWLDLTPLRDDLERRGEDYNEANGLAWDGPNGRLLVTGKNWPQLYAVRI